MYVKQPVVHNAQSYQHVRVNFNQEPTQYKTMPQVNLPSRYSNSEFSQYHPRYYPVPVTRPVGIAAPQEYEVETQQYHYVPKKEKSCCGDDRDPQVIFEDNLSIGSGKKKYQINDRFDTWAQGQGNNKLRQIFNKFERMNGDSKNFVMPDLGEGYEQDSSEYEQEVAKQNLLNLQRRRNKRMRRKRYYEKYGDSDSEGEVTALRNDTVKHWNGKKDFSYVFDKAHKGSSKHSGHHFGHGPFHSFNSGYHFYDADQFLNKHKYMY